MNVSGITAFLRDKVAVFEGFPEDRLKEISEGARITTFEPHEAVIEFGEE